MRTKLHFVLSLTMFLTLFSAVGQESYWQKTDEKIRSNDGKSTLNEKFYQTYKLDIDRFKTQLTSAPLRSNNNATSNSNTFKK